jgi:hypothetical protein
MMMSTAVTSRRTAVVSSPLQDFFERIADRLSQGDRLGIERSGAAVEGEYKVVSPLDGPFEEAADRENGWLIAVCCFAGVFEDESVGACRQGSEQGSA